MSADVVVRRISEHRTDVLLARPDKRNALTTSMLRTLAEVFADPPASTRVMVLGSTDERAFCAGADLVEHRAHTPEQAVDTSLVGSRALAAVSGCPVPVVARLSGHVLGGGFELALACDLRVADSTICMAFPEVSLGHAPAWGGIPRLVSLVGPARAKDLLLSGRGVDVAEAHRLGLVDRCAPAGGLDAAVDDLAASLADAPRLSVLTARLSVDAATPTPGVLTDALGAGFFASIHATDSSSAGATPSPSSLTR